MRQRYLRSVPLPPSCIPRCEELEPRWVPSGVTVHGRRLTIRGTDAADRVLIRDHGNGTLAVAVNGQRVVGRRIAELAVRTGAGADRVQFLQAGPDRTDLLARIRLGDGNDTFTAFLSGSNRPGRTLQCDVDGDRGKDHLRVRTVANFDLAAAGGVRFQLRGVEGYDSFAVPLPLPEPNPIPLPFPPPVNQLEVRVTPATAERPWVVYEPSVHGFGLGTLPVVAYLHGAGQADAARYDDILRRLAGAGYLVVFPLYGANPLDFANWESRAHDLLTAALAELRVGTDYAVNRADLDRFALVGHSMGGFLALSLANQAPTDPELPEPDAVLLHDAAGFSFTPFLTTPLLEVQQGAYRLERFDRFASLDPKTWVVAAMAETTYAEALAEHHDNDAFVFGNDNAGGVVARALHAPGLTAGRQHLFVVHGGDGLVSGHEGVQSLVQADLFTPPVREVNEVDALYWRLTEATLRAAFGATGGLTLDLAPAWEDGTPQVTRVESPPPAAFAWNCAWFEAKGLAPVIVPFLPPNTCA